LTLLHPAEQASAAFLLSHFPSIPLTVDQYIAERTAIQNTKWSTLSLLPGVERLLTYLKEKNVPMAIATSSKRFKYEKKVAHLPIIAECFHNGPKQRVICSSDEELVQRGKPNPDIFLAAARELLGRDVGYADVPPAEVQILERSKGLVFEDSVAGVQAGKRAGMKGASFQHATRRVPNKVDSGLGSRFPGYSQSSRRTCCRRTTRQDNRFSLALRSRRMGTRLFFQALALL
jgi:beta-phosphoglucomutase-like phosphatase (HAD superfamily)